MQNHHSHIVYVRVSQFWSHQDPTHLIQMNGRYPSLITTIDLNQVLEQENISNMQGREARGPGLGTPDLGECVERIWMDPLRYIANMATSYNLLNSTWKICQCTSAKWQQPTKHDLTSILI